MGCHWGGVGALSFRAPYRAVLVQRRSRRWRGGRKERQEGLAVGLGVPRTWLICETTFLLYGVYTHTHSHSHKKAFSHRSCVSTGSSQIWFSAWECSSSHAVGVTSPSQVGPELLLCCFSHMKTLRSPSSWEHMPALIAVFTSMSE